MQFNLTLSIIALVTFIFLFRYIILYFNSSQGKLGIIFTILLCFSILLVALIPSSVRNISQSLGLGTNLNTIIYVGFVSLFIIVIELFLKIDRLMEKIEILTRAQAMEEFKNKEESK